MKSILLRIKSSRVAVFSITSMVACAASLPAAVINRNTPGSSINLNITATDAPSGILSTSTGSAINLVTASANNITFDSGILTSASTTATGVSAMYAEIVNGFLKFTNRANATANNLQVIQLCANGPSGDIWMENMAGVQLKATAMGSNAAGIAAWPGSISNTGHRSYIKDYGSTIIAPRGIAIHSFGTATNGAYTHLITAATINATVRGIDADNAGNGKDASVAVENTGNISVGLTAQVVSNGNDGHDAAIYAYSRGIISISSSGDLSTYLNGAASHSNMHAIWAQTDQTVANSIDPSSGMIKGNIYIGYKASFAAPVGNEHEDMGKYLGVDTNNNEVPLTGNISTADKASNGIYALANRGNVYISTAASIKTAGSTSHGIYASSNDSVNIKNTGTIDATNTGSVGIYVANSSSGTIVNSGKVYSQSESGTAIQIDGKNITTTLSTGSDLRGSVLSKNTGNALVFQGVVTEDSKFTASTAANNFTGLTVNTNGTDNTVWTLNSTDVNAQMTGIGGNISIVNGANATTARLNLTPALAGNYTFNRSIAGNGTLGIALYNQSNTINFGTAVGTTFAGTFALGQGIFDLTAASVNAATVNNAILRLEENNLTNVTGTSHTAGLELLGDSTLTFKSNGLLNTNHLKLDTTSGEKITVNFDNYFTPSGDGTYEEAYLLIAFLDGAEANGGSLLDANSYFDSGTGAIAGYGFAWNQDGLVYMLMSPTPEPSSFALFSGIGTLIAVASRRRRYKTAR